VASKIGARLSFDRGYHGLVARREPRGQRAPVAARAADLHEPVGKSVAALARFYKIAPDEILVAHDELDLLPGR